MTVGEPPRPSKNSRLAMIGERPNLSGLLPSTSLVQVGVETNGFLHPQLLGLRLISRGADGRRSMTSLQACRCREKVNIDVEMTQ